MMAETAQAFHLEFRPFSCWEAAAKVGHRKVVDTVAVTQVDKPVAMAAIVTALLPRLQATMAVLMIYRSD